MSALINTPTYILNNLDIPSLSKSKKLYYLFIGLIFVFLEKILSPNKFCFFVNKLSFVKVKVSYKDNFFIVKDDFGEFYYTNNRFTRMLGGILNASKKLVKEYILEDLDFKNEDTIIDCGSNVGELCPYFIKKFPLINYVAFEPDKEIFSALEKNHKFANGSKHCVALSDNEEDKELYIDSIGADTSLEDNSSKNSYLIKTKMLDQFNFQNVKLIKIDGEGHEEKILKGAEKTLLNTQYVSVDHGAEKGIDNARTTPEVYSFLINIGFKPLVSSGFREITLFKNMNI